MGFALDRGAGRCGSKGRGTTEEETALTGVKCGSRLRLLGGFQLELSGTVVNPPANGRRLLAFLGIRGSSPRSLVAGTLWPEVTEHNAQGSLRTTMWRLHRAGPTLIDAVGERLALGAGLAVDCRDLALAVAGTAGQRTGVRERVLLDGGELLPGWYDDWVIFERERLRQLRLHALEAYAQLMADEGDYARALQLVLEAVQSEPLRESAHRVVIGIHLAEGNVVEALRHYAFVRDLLRSELGIAPSRRLTALLPVTGP
ncbi:BTAD domain-containing putative transcriptional regulator [Actinomadura sp. 6N118]|uniref:AfsR/SARP family transcriptional regulator n=1 Tax=Actinomadura sp. 6N118 TaxID=3375151 RepID=UPI00379C1EF8